MRRERWRAGLEDGARVAVIGGGPAGAFQSYFLLQLARRAGLRIEVDLYEPRSFGEIGPRGCNMCGGIVSESLLQNLAAEGINLPPAVIHRRIDSYVLHMDVGSVRIETPLREKRIAAVHRGSGPRGGIRLASFDQYLLQMAVDSGACLIQERVTSIDREHGRPRVHTAQGPRAAYDLLAVATGVNSSLPKVFESTNDGYRRPRSTKAYVSEFPLGKAMIDRYLGNSMHVFLLNIPRLEFAALIPKSEYVTACLLGHDLDKQLMASFLGSPELRRCMPPHWEVPDSFCHCSPKIVVDSAIRPFGDRLVFVGDCGTTRLYKDGIGASYRLAKAAARTAVFRGVSAEAFRRHYWPVCESINKDNGLGRLVFWFTRRIQERRRLRRAVWTVTSREQSSGNGQPRMSSVLWDTFTGSATYSSVLGRSLHPALLGRLALGVLNGGEPREAARPQEKPPMTQNVTGFMGKKYREGDVIYRQGEPDSFVYVIQEGEVELVRRENEKEFCLGVLRGGNMFGEAALFEKEPVRSTTARAASEVYVFTLDKQTLLKRLDEDPSLAFQLLHKMTRRIRDLENSLIRVGARSWEAATSS